ncbi:hypothetical protein [Lactobacillus corticis]|uniref:Uncharacterized protein n=1 Tax=Lactobacillus corticis TaxID=2201249 RepID=A0A916QGN2_9LACO|nr:hypothetical protein [Lactobacillus corticis]GFZ26634.1 hypothetical protein LCB40_05140 [Lactobacillus corticis]
MSYISFYFKRAMKSKLTWGLVCFVLVVVLCVFYENSNTTDTRSISADLKNDRSELVKSIKQEQRFLKQEKTSQKDAKAYKKAIIQDQQKLAKIEQLLQEVKKGKYSEAYKFEIKSLKSDTKIATKNPQGNAYLITEDQAKQQYYQYLLSHQLADEGEDFPTHAWTFMIDLTSFFLPVLVIFIITFILVESFSQRFKDQIDLESLFPAENKLGANLSQVVSGLFISIFLLALIYLVIFFVASSASGIGTLTYPIRTYGNNSQSQIKFIPAATVIMKSLILQLLFLINLTLGVQLITYWLKNKMSALFTSLLFTVALPILPFVVTPMKPWAQWLPTTYLFSTLTVTGAFGKTIKNPQLNFNTGVQVLGICLIVLLIVVVVLDHLKNTRTKHA